MVVLCIEKHLFLVLNIVFYRWGAGEIYRAKDFLSRHWENHEGKRCLRG